ncbi:MAG: enoyl-CoA hydratase family protein [Nocardioidaceae bacterium]|nr:enoyl-CoA hydratase family protein [Nocardioidaceae bacterium]
MSLAVERAVATVTLESPSNRNALSTRLVMELHDTLRTALDDDSVRAVVLTGAGPVFCAGADLKERRSENAEPPRVSFPEVLEMIHSSDKPVVVKMNGPARAGGLGLVAAADIAIAPSAATFAFSEVHIGVAPAMIAVPCTRRMTARSVHRYFLTGETFDAPTAAQIGLVTMAVEDVDAACDSILESLRRAAPGALAATKGLIEEARDVEFGTALRSMEAESMRLFSGDEAREGMSAFLEKRKPAWVQTN